MEAMAQQSISHPEELRTRRDILELFWRKGISGNALLKENTALIDSHLQQNFAKCPNIEGIALVPVGGYGRMELFPFSDIDLLLLHEPSATSELDQITEAIFYPLWDAGLDVGHSVRTVDACTSFAEKDFFFQVALLDARFLAGSRKLYAKLQEEYTNKFVNGRRLEFLTEMVFHRQERHRRFGQHSYHLEPQIKESRGGLRDIQAMLWTARFVFGLNDLAAVKEAGLLNDLEYHNFDKARNYLIKIRNRLHYISGRNNDRLFFEHQEEIAKALKYKKSKGMLGVELFMRDVYQHMQIISTCTDLFFEHTQEVVSHTANSSGVLSRKIEEGLSFRKEHLYVSSAKQFSQKPSLLMKVFCQAAELQAPIHYSTRKLITANLHLVDDSFRSSKPIAKLFLKLIQQPGCIPALEVMLESGFLAAYLPEFGNLKSLAQHDIYHVYTVDHHQIQTVAAMHEMSKTETDIFATATNTQILFLAALLHDIGKGTGKDHSQEGAKLGGKIAQRFGLSESDTALLTFLIGNHLFMTEIAMHRDLEDDAMIKRCAAHIQSQNHLTLLYLLSIADAKATGPTVWNDWKSALLLEIYLKTGLYFDKSGRTPNDITDGIKWIKEKTIALVGDHQSAFIDSLSSDYLMSFTPEEICCHIKSRTGLKEGETRFIPTNKGNHTSLLLITQDRPELLSKICGVIALHNLKVLNAKIFTWPDGTAVDSLDVISYLDNDVEGQNYQNFKDDLDLAINHRLGLEHRLNKKAISSLGFSSKLAPKQDVKVSFDNETSDTYTIIEVYAQDKAVLLYLITRTLSYYKISIYRAKIGNHLDQVLDVFYVLDHNGQKLTDQSFIEEIRQDLLFAASNG